MILSYSRRRRHLCFLLYASGLSRLALRLKPRQQTLILTGHRVLEAEDPVERLLVDSRAATSKDEFEKRIRFLVTHFRPVSMDDYVGGTGGPSSFVLTFDDGYRDNVTLALPILQRYRVPMHLFITTGFINGQIIPWEARLARACSTAGSGNYPVASLRLELRLTEPVGRSVSFGQFCQAMKCLDVARIKMILDEIESLPGVVPLTTCDGSFLSPRELTAGDNLISFGAHSVTHANFRMLDQTAIAAEAEGSRQSLEAATGLPVCTFAYPYGFASDRSRDYFDHAMAAPAASWRHVFGTGGGRAGDPFEDRRLSFDLQPFYVFHVEISGAWALFRQVFKR